MQLSETSREILQKFRMRIGIGIGTMRKAIFVYCRLPSGIRKTKDKGSKDLALMNCPLFYIPAICEDPEIKERIIQLRSEQETKLKEAAVKKIRRSVSSNSRTQSIRRTSQRDKGLTTKRDAADEALVLMSMTNNHDKVRLVPCHSSL